MDAMVTARVPVEIKRQGDAVLKTLGSSATELVNAAYEYVLKHKALPLADREIPSETLQRKTLDGERARELCASLESSRVLDTPGYDGSNYKELLAALREEQYAHLD